MPRRRPRLILSRKGFDSAAGGIPSPRLGSECLSLPIPQAETGLFYRDLSGAFGQSYLDTLQALGVNFFSEAHLDPDLSSPVLPRQPGWRPLFGQHGAALSHLQHEGVGPGDLFLFFGWFRQAERVGERGLRFLRGAPDQHLIYGYLEVGETLDPATDPIPAWATYHPHVKFREQYGPAGNHLFVGAEKSSWLPGMPGAGTLGYHPRRVLTLPAAKGRSCWQLPAAFFVPEGACRLSYHRHKKGKPATKRGWYELDAAKRGQEFVVEADPAIKRWVKALLKPGC